MDFTNKIVVFVGGLGAIGFESCKQIVKKDIAYLCILDAVESSNSIEELKSMNLTCKVRYVKFDITNKASIQNAIAVIVEETKYIDILVNCAGILKESDVELTIKTNLIGLINTTYEVLPYMDKRKFARGGLIVNVASVNGLEPFSDYIAYSSSKCGVVGFTRCMADQHYYETTGIAVCAICPGLTDSPLRNCASENYTFEYSKVLTERFKFMKSQSSSTCGRHLLRVIEANKNGSIWISDYDNLTEVKLAVYWTPVPR